MKFITLKRNNINRIALSCAKKTTKEALDKKALDNISWIVIWFENLINFLNGRPANNSSLSNYVNFDLTEYDIDKNHSSKAIDNVLIGINKSNILNEGYNAIEKYTAKPEIKEGLFFKSSSQNIVPGKDFQPSISSSYKLPQVRTTNKPYTDSFKNAKGAQYVNPLKETGKMKLLKTIETKESDFDEQVRTRHHTQPRISNKPFGFASGYSITSKNMDTGPYINALQPRIKSGGKNGFNVDHFSSLRREHQNEVFKRGASQSSANEISSRMFKPRLNIPMVTAGSNPLGSVPSSNSKMQLQGFTIRPDNKYPKLPSRGS